MTYLAWSYFVVACLIWCGFYWRAMRAKQSIRPLTFSDAPVRVLPLLSVIIAARNEATTLPAALDKLIQQPYPKLEIIIVNDRSTDDTGAIIDTYAARDQRIKPIHIDSLPNDWLGKPHALHIATQSAQGEWYLFTDADVHHSDRLWIAAVNQALEHKLDHLALLPNVTSKGWLIQATIKAFGLLFLTTARAHAIRNPDSPAAIGIGAFNLVRADKFKQCIGFEWLRMEVADDYGLALMMKANGGKSDLLFAYDDLHVEWYSNIKAMVHGLDKNIMAPGTHYQTHKLILSPIFFGALLIAPFVSLLTYPEPLFWPGVFTLVFVSWPSLVIARDKKESMLHWLLSPVGFLVIAYIFARACLMCLIRDGIYWRGTYYPRKQLQQYQRVKH